MEPRTALHRSEFIVRSTFAESQSAWGPPRTLTLSLLPLAEANSANRSLVNPTWDEPPRLPLTLLGPQQVFIKRCLEVLSPPCPSGHGRRTFRVLRLAGMCYFDHGSCYYDHASSSAPKPFSPPSSSRSSPGSPIPANHPPWSLSSSRGSRPAPNASIGKLDATGPNELPQRRTAVS